MRFEIKTQINKEAVNRRMVAQELTDDLSYCSSSLVSSPLQRTKERSEQTSEANGVSKLKVTASFIHILSAYSLEFGSH